VLGPGLGHQDLIEADQREQTETLSTLAAVALRPDRDEVLARLGPDRAADVDHAVAIYAGGSA
jgi:hypothetical protein